MTSWKDEFLPPHPLRVGQRVSSGRATGTIVEIYTEVSQPQHRVDVRWEDGGKSYRPAEGLIVLMSPEDIEDAKARLGAAWGLKRPLHNSELARALRLGGRDPGRSVQDWLSGKTTITGPVQVAIQMMLAGAMPPDPLTAILR